MLTPEGHVKVMDFGLAKRLIPVEGVESQEKTLTASLTKTGTTLGTLAYMSPEQVRGQEVDTRSDIFSFGVVLYEMLTGVHPFRKDLPMETGNAILNEAAPPLTRYTDDVPELLEHTLKKMLAKEPDQRYQLIHDVRTDLKELSDQMAAAPGVVVPPAVGTLSRLGWGPWAAGVAILVVLLAILIVMLKPPAGPTTSESLLPPMETVPLTSYPGFEGYPSFSPEGNQVAFSWDGKEQDNFDIYVKLIGPGEPLRLTTDPARDLSPAWSPDGRFIAFLRLLSAEKAAVVLIPALGGPERKLAEIYARDAPTLSSGSHLAWSPDGQWLVVPHRDSPEEPMGLFLLSVSPHFSH